MFDEYGGKTPPPKRRHPRVAKIDVEGNPVPGTLPMRLVKRPAELTEQERRELAIYDRIYDGW